MDKRTAIRNFADPSYTPAKGTRIHKDKYYLVRMQEVVTNPMIDYVGLGDGEYVELIPGDKARQRRDAKLNHCNAVVEYTGPVWKVTCDDFNVGNWSDVRYYPDAESARRAVADQEGRRHKWLADMDHQASNYESYDAAKVIDHAKQSGVGIARIGDFEWVAQQVIMYQGWAADVRRKIAEWTGVPWNHRIEQVR